MGKSRARFREGMSSPGRTEASAYRRILRSFLRCPKRRARPSDGEDERELEGSSRPVEKDNLVFVDSFRSAWK